MNYTEIRAYTSQPEYNQGSGTQCGQESYYAELSEGRNSETGTYNAKLHK